MPIQATVQEVQARGIAMRQPLLDQADGMASGGAQQETNKTHNTLGRRPKF